MTEKKKFRAYILLRLSAVGKEWEVCDRISKIFERERVPYACPVYGAWDVVVEITFDELNQLDGVVTEIREDSVLKGICDETTTMVAARNTYPW
ncbi:MAG: Lrp/AsnC ligand binding domain-containing protein [Candidatus Helarchaeota archaeon]